MPEHRSDRDCRPEGFGDIAELGLTLPEAKQLLASVQRAVISARVVSHGLQRSCCSACSGKCHLKDWRGHHIATLFGAVTVPLPRLRCHRLQLHRDERRLAIALPIDTKWRLITQLLVLPRGGNYADKTCLDGNRHHQRASGICGEETHLPPTSKFSVCDRITVYDDRGPTLNAITTINAQVLVVADELDKAWQTTGPVGPLHGIPMLLKDNIDTAEMPTTSDSRLLRDWVPPCDATITSALRTAGAIIPKVRGFSAGCKKAKIARFACSILFATLVARSVMLPWGGRS